MEGLLARLRAEGEHETYPPAAEDEVLSTEQAIGRPLPPSFRQFLGSFSNGAYLLMLQEVSAAGAGNPQIGAIQDVLPTMVENPGSRLPLDSGEPVLAAALVPFSLDHNGNCWCFITSEPSPDGEYPVAYYDTRHGRLYGRLPGFRAWLTTLLDEQDEVIRTLYDDHVIQDELGLG
jgi:hypothetical protein